VIEVSDPGSTNEPGLLPEVMTAFSWVFWTCSCVSDCFVSSSSSRFAI
jgi:hypothetical protein